MHAMHTEKTKGHASCPYVATMGTKHMRLLALFRVHRVHPMLRGVLA